MFKLLGALMIVTSLSLAIVLAPASNRVAVGLDEVQIDSEQQFCVGRCHNDAEIVQRSVSGLPILDFNQGSRFRAFGGVCRDGSVCVFGLGVELNNC